MFALFMALLAAWIAILVVKKANVHKIHYLMLGLLVCKALTLLAQALMTMHLERTGEPEVGGWEVLLSALSCLPGALAGPGLRSASPSGAPS